MNTNKLICMVVMMVSFCAYAGVENAPKPWSFPKVEQPISDNVLYIPIADSSVKSLPINESGEELIDLLKMNNPRIKPMSAFSLKYQNTYEGFSKVRYGVYEKLLKMLELLPQQFGIAYFEGFRPLHKQKEYFDNKFKEFLVTTNDKELAYQETSKQVSPFIDNIPTHTTGAAIDITLFIIKEGQEELLDMGKFDVISGPNDQQETFSENTTKSQRNNRLLLLAAATNAGLVNYGFEWWHYSYGDKAWAFVKKQKEAIFGLTVPKNDPILSIDKKTYLESF